MFGIKFNKTKKVKEPKPKKETAFERLINSDRYKNSRYVIELHNNDYYVLKDKYKDVYVDLDQKYYTWAMNQYEFRQCKGTLGMVIRAFNYNVPIVEEVKTLKRF